MYNKIIRQCVKSCLMLLALLLIAANQTFAQGVGINSVGAPAHSSAMLDVSSTNSGVLIPRITEVQKNAIPNPATGLLIYQTDGIAGFWYYNGSTWVQSIGVAGTTGPAGAAGFLPSGSAAGNTPYWDGNQWVVNSSNIYNNGGSIGIGTVNPDASAIIDINSTTQGTLITRMTTAQRNAITLPATGLQVYNTDCHNFNYNAGTPAAPVWIDWSTPIIPSSPVQGVHLPSYSGQYQVVWNWNAVQWALGYKYNTVNDYNSAIDNGTLLTWTQTGLTCNTVRTLYVWAYNNCGYSAPVTMTALTTNCPYICGSANVDFTYNGVQVSYGNVAGQFGTCWLDKNLGASAVATAIAHSAGYGDLFQWGRLDDGHQTRSPLSSTTTTLSTTDNPNHNKFIFRTFSTLDDWRDPPNDALWQGPAGINNPCPLGWRIPTMAEWQNERLGWTGGNNYNGAIQSTLKLPSAGYRTSHNGATGATGTRGDYWASTVNGKYAYFLVFYNTDAHSNYDFRAEGKSVRCIMD